MSQINNSESNIETEFVKETEILQKNELSLHNPDKEKQLKMMVVVTGKLTNQNNDYTVLATPGCEIIKTWRIMNKSDYQWPTNAFLKSK